MISMKPFKEAPSAADISRCLASISLLAAQGDLQSDWYTPGPKLEFHRRQRFHALKSQLKTVEAFFAFPCLLMA